MGAPLEITPWLGFINSFSKSFHLLEQLLDSGGNKGFILSI